MILACNHIEKKFNDETLFSDVSFHINEQECMALVGVNGVARRGKKGYIGVNGVAR